MTAAPMESAASIAVVAVTRGGAVHAQRLSEQLPHATLFLPAKWCADQRSARTKLYACRLSDLVAELFPRVRFLIFFAALGAVVRVLAPHLRDKRSDPGVLVVDEGAHHVVSVLSGHAGGANELASRVAALLGASPVITTASDTQGVFALDLLGSQEGWACERAHLLTHAMAALVNGAEVTIIQEAGETGWQDSPAVPANVQIYSSLGAYTARAEGRPTGPVVLITDRVSPLAQLPEETVVYRPKTLVVGMGCERGVSLEELEVAMTTTLKTHDLAFTSIKHLATVSVKEDEAGLNALAAKHHLPVRHYSPEQLCAVKVPNPSTAVAQAIGAPGVCEPAALLGAGASELLVPKVKHGRVTVAVARVPGGTSPQSQSHGALYLVGIGPGGLPDMTSRARSVIGQAEVVIGYRLYVDLMRDLLSGKKIVASELSEEWMRARLAIEWAAKGHRVVLLSSGDIGIYGMAGPVFEQLYERGWRPGGSFAVEVVPGITAASSCAALLGAPLMHDFVVISLSDRLTPWAVIRDRLEAAARADFVVVLYNPRSERRQQQLLEAQQILLRHKPPQTPVGVITRCGREGENVRIATVETFIVPEIGMFTTVIVGNAATLATEDFMVTRRGYNQDTDGERQNEESHVETVSNKEARR